MVNSTEAKLKSIEIKKNGLKLSPTLSHAKFLSGKSDERGDLMSKLALINVETMKIVKEETEKISRRNRLHPSAKAAKLRKYVEMHIL